MFISDTTNLYPRDDDGTVFSKQNIIIIAVCGSVGFLVLVFALFRLIRNCRRSSKSAPLPPPQPLARQREQQVALFEESGPRATTWYQQQPADHQIRPNSLSGSRQSLLGKESPGLSPSIPPSTESVQDLETPSHCSSQHLPLPNSSFYPPRRPGSRSSFNSSDASCTPPLSSNHSFSPDGTTPSFPSPARRSRSTRHARPLSMSSTYTYGTTTSRSTSRVRGVPHAPHNQIQIVLPTPLASANNSRESLALPRGRIASASGSLERRSVADAWINLSSGTYGLADKSAESLPETVPKTPRRRPASMSAPAMSPVLFEGQAMVPPVPHLPKNESVESASLNHSPQTMQPSGTKGRKLEKRRIQS